MGAAAAQRAGASIAIYPGAYFTAAMDPLPAYRRGITSALHTCALELVQLSA